MQIDWAQSGVPAAVAERVARVVARPGGKRIAVPGGATPTAVFAEFAEPELDWRGCEVWPTDDRQVPPDHPASNFGKLGERPTNPELLEYLATSFVEGGYSIKKLHRQIMLSAVYQSSTDDAPAAYAKDSGNRWYWRANRRRLEVEGRAVREARDGVWWYRAA